MDSFNGLSFLGCGFTISVPDIIKVLVYGKFSAGIQSVYQMFGISLLTYGVFIIIYLIVCNKMILSNSYITIKRFELGKTYKIDKKCLIGKRLISKSTKEQFVDQADNSNNPKLMSQLIKEYLTLDKIISSEVIER